MFDINRSKDPDVVKMRRQISLAAMREVLYEDKPVRDYLIYRGKRLEGYKDRELMDQVSAKREFAKMISAGSFDLRRNPVIVQRNPDRSLFIWDGNNRYRIATILGMPAWARLEHGRSKVLHERPVHV